MKLASQCATVQWSKYLDYTHSHENIISIFNQQMLGLIYVHTLHEGITLQIQSWVGELQSAEYAIFHLNSVSEWLSPVI